MKEEKREGKERGDSLDLLTGKNFLATPLQKNLCIIYKKLQSLDLLHGRLLLPRSLRSFKS